MQILTRITFKNMKHSDILEEHIKQQRAKIEEFLANEATPVYIDVVVESNGEKQYYKLTSHVKSPSYDCYAEHTGTDPYTQANEVLDRMYDQLRRAKRALVDSQKSGCDSECRQEYFEEMEEEALASEDEDKE